MNTMPEDVGPLNTQTEARLENWSREQKRSKFVPSSSTASYLLCHRHKQMALFLPNQETLN
jgi:hypothetical protein